MQDYNHLAETIALQHLIAYQKLLLLEYIENPDDEYLAEAIEDVATRIEAGLADAKNKEQED